MFVSVHIVLKVYFSFKPAEIQFLVTMTTVTHTDMADATSVALSCLPAQKAAPDTDECAARPLQRPDHYTSIVAVSLLVILLTSVVCCFGKRCYPVTMFY